MNDRELVDLVAFLTLQGAAEGGKNCNKRARLERVKLKLSPMVRGDHTVSYLMQLRAMEELLT